jgi:hypothetical protein
LFTGLALALVLFLHPGFTGLFTLEALKNHFFGGFFFFFAIHLTKSVTYLSAN